MALKVTLNLEKGAFPTDASHRVFSGYMLSDNVSFYDDLTGVNLNNSNLESDDLTSFVGETMADGVTPILSRIGRAIQEGILSVSEGIFPAAAAVNPILASHAMGDLTLVPSTTGKRMSLVWDDDTNTLTAIEYNFNGITMPFMPVYPKTSGVSPDVLWPYDNPIT